MSKLQEVKERIKQIQDENFQNDGLIAVAEKFNPGQTGFIPPSGYILMNPVEPELRKKANIILNKSQQQATAKIADFKGVYPLLGIVMEVGREVFDYKIGDVVLVSPTAKLETVVFDGCEAVLTPNHKLLGTDGSLTKIMED